MRNPNKKKSAIELEEQNLIAKGAKTVRQIHRKCFDPDCSEDAISSHLLWEAGPLKDLANTKREVFQLENNAAVKATAFRIAAKNIENAGGRTFRFPGFCAAHDRQTFKPIENLSIDFNSPKTHLLFAYRSICYKMADYRDSIDSFTPIVRSQSGRDGFRDFLRGRVRMLEVGLLDLSYHKRKIEEALKSGSTQFYTFYIREIERIDFACSGVIYPPGFSFVVPNTNILTKNLPASFLHVIPVNGKSIVLFGHHKDAVRCENIAVREFLNLPTFELETFMSAAIVKYIQSWCISERLYNHIHAKGIDQQILDSLMIYQQDEKAIFKPSKVNWFKEFKI